jgi:hypothetical protein
MPVDLHWAMLADLCKDWQKDRTGWQILTDLHSECQKDPRAW